jgi:hypothetical protein
MITTRAQLLSLITTMAVYAPAALAQPEQTPAGAKPAMVVVLIYDDSCITSCTVVKPIVRELASEKMIQYEELNTSREHLKETMAKAKSLGVEKFVGDRTEEVPVVGLFSNHGKKLGELTGRKTKDVYKEAIEKAMRKVKV